MTKIEELVSEAFGNDFYDMADELSESVVACVVNGLLQGLYRHESCEVAIWHYTFFVSADGRTVSVSNDDCTGVSQSLSRVIPDDVFCDSMLDIEMVQELVSMMNEAWYALLYC